MRHRRTSGGTGPEPPPSPPPSPPQPYPPPSTPPPPPPLPFHLQLTHLRCHTNGELPLRLRHPHRDLDHTGTTRLLFRRARRDGVYLHGTMFFGINAAGRTRPACMQPGWHARQNSRRWARHGLRCTAMGRARRASGPGWMDPAARVQGDSRCESAEARAAGRPARKAGKLSRIPSQPPRHASCCAARGPAHSQGGAEGRGHVEPSRQVALLRELAQLSGREAAG